MNVSSAAFAMKQLNKKFGVWARREWSESRECDIYVISHGDTASSHISRTWDRAYRKYQDHTRPGRLRLV